jgi:putative copper export protein
LIALSGAAANGLFFTGLVLMVGASSARWLVIPRAFTTGAEHDDAVASAARVGLLGARLLPVAMALLFHRQLADFRDPFATLGEDVTLLLRGTEWGSRFVLTLGGSVAALGMWSAARRGRAWAWVLVAPLGAALAAYPAFSGHASGTGDLAALTVSADTAHVLAAGIWLGGLAFLLYADRRSHRSLGVATLPHLVPAYSPFAAGSVTVLLLTGLVGAWAQLDGPTALVTTTYGRLLLTKVVLATVMMGLGFRNWKHLTPNLGTRQGAEVLRKSATAELMVGQIVLLLTAVLVRISPLGH